LVNLDGLKVLAIDDESDTLLLLRTLLEEAGAEVYTADRARTGLAILKEVKPGVVLCDLAMPDEDGYSFLLKVRRLSSEEGGDIPVIAVTAFARAEDRAKAERAGFESHIVKPFEPPDLLFAVLRAVQGKTAAA
jgi:CheY-like chemotaxis protein